MAIGTRKVAFTELPDKTGLEQLIDESSAQDVQAGIIDVNTKDRDGATPLMRAWFKGQLATVKALLSKGADPNVKAPNGGTALMLALVKNQTAVARVLIDGGADVNAKSNDGGTALMAAVAVQNIEIIQALLAKGADVNAKSEGGVTALQLAEKGVTPKSSKDAKKKHRCQGGLTNRWPGDTCFITSGSVFRNPDSESGQACDFCDFRNS